MYFSVAEQEIALKDLKVRFAVDRGDTSKVVLTVNSEGKDCLVATFSRNGYPLSVEEPAEEGEHHEESQPLGAREPTGDQSSAKGNVEQRPVGSGAAPQGRVSEF